MITLSEEQGMLLSTALDFCAREAPIASLRGAIQEGLPLMPVAGKPWSNWAGPVLSFQSSTGGLV